MNTQMILALGAMVLLSLIIINTNKTALNTEDTMYDSTFGIIATSIGTSIIEEASRKHFDDKTDTIYIETKDLSVLTAADKMGIESDENISNSDTFDDFDDFNGYAATDTSLPSAPFKINVKVNYVDPLIPDKPIASRSFHKKIEVSITSDFMRDTVRQSSIFSYWIFR